MPSTRQDLPISHFHPYNITLRGCLLGNVFGQLTINIMINKLKTLVEAVEKAGIDIAPQYDEWVRMAFAISTDCGEAGRVYFLRLCRLYPQYDERKTSRMYDAALKKSEGRIHLGTVFYLAKKRGVKLAPEADFAPEAESAPAETKVESGPLLPGCFERYAWPCPISDVLALFEDERTRDVLFLSCVTVIGAVIGRHLSFEDDDKTLHPVLQTWIVGASSSGKSKMPLPLVFAATRHRILKEKYKSQLEEYRQKKAEGQKTVFVQAADPDRPNPLLFLLSPDNTAANLLQNLVDNGGEGLISATEAETVTKSIENRWGGWRDVIRCASDHETIRAGRKMEKEDKEVSDPCLAILVSGTPGQMTRYFCNAEDGLFQRSLLYFLPRRDDYIRHKQRSCRVSDIMNDLGEAWGKRLEDLRASNMRFVLTDEKWEALDDAMQRLYDFIPRTDDDMRAWTARLRTAILRIMSVVAVLRGFENDDRFLDFNDCVRINDEDFTAVLKLAFVLQTHAWYAYSLLPKKRPVVSSRDADRAILFQSMPDTFTRKAFLQKARELGIETGGLDNLLMRCVKKDLLTRTKQGEYYKNN